jgi:hypothetical protein
MKYLYRFSRLISFILFTAHHVHPVAPGLFKPTNIINPPSFTISIKNVGQGSCTAIRNHENNKLLLIDAGSLSDKPSESEGRILEEFGFCESNPDIPLPEDSITVVVSHTDKDHINLFKSIFGIHYHALERLQHIYLGDHFDNYFRIKETREFVTDFLAKVPGIEEKLTSLSHDLRDIDLKSALHDPEKLALPREKHRGFQPKFPLRGFLTDAQRALEGYAFECMGVNAGKTEAVAETPSERDTNLNSAVVRLSIAGKNIVVMGDATNKTTDRIIASIDNPADLRTTLLVASHHGAEENTNYITWSAVAAPQRVVMSTGFNAGYKHPTLAAVANYLVTGLESHELYPEALWEGTTCTYEDEHFIFLYNSIGPHIAALRPQIRGIEFCAIYPKRPDWAVFRTKKSIYSTSSSGELSYTFAANGKLLFFDKEY